MKEEKNGVDRGQSKKKAQGGGNVEVPNVNAESMLSQHYTWCIVPSSDAHNLPGDPCIIS